LVMRREVIVASQIVGSSSNLGAKGPHFIFASLL